MDEIISTKLKTKRSRACQRCGGQLIYSHDEINCLQCGAPHTREGQLVLTFTVQEYEALLALEKSISSTDVTGTDSMSRLN